MHFSVVNYRLLSVIFLFMPQLLCLPMMAITATSRRGNLSEAAAGTASWGRMKTIKSAITPAGGVLQDCADIVKRHEVAVTVGGTAGAHTSGSVDNDARDRTDDNDDHIQNATDMAIAAMDIDMEIGRHQNDALRLAFQRGEVRSLRTDSGLSFKTADNNANTKTKEIEITSISVVPTTNVSNDWITMTKKNRRPLGAAVNDSVTTSRTRFGDGGGANGGRAINGSGVASGAKKLHFPPAPIGERILITAPSVLPLATFSTLLGLLQPIAFPLEILKEAAQGRLAFHALLLQVTKVEAAVVLWSVCWLIAAAYVPYTSIGEICCRRGKFLQRLENDSSASSLEHADTQRRLQHDHDHARRRPRRRADLQRRWSDSCSTFLLNIILLLLIASVGLMLAGSEQAHRSMDVAAGGSGGGSRRRLLALEDAERFARNSEMQIAFVTATSLEIALDAVDKDLQDAENLLGKPIKQTFDEYYNLENTFLSLKLIQQDTIDISKTVTALKETSLAAMEAADKLQRRLDNLIPLVRNIRQICDERDGPLCETITENGLVVTFDVKDLIADGKLIYLGGISTQTQFNSTLHDAEMNYQDIARKIALETTGQRAAIRTSLERHRIDIHKRLRVLEDTSRSLIASIKRAGDALAPYRSAIASWEMWRYLLTFGLVIILFISWVFLLCGSPCCCTNTKITYTVLGAMLAAIAAILAWCLATAMLVLGVHGETFLCRPLYDPQYETLSALLDNGGLFIPNGGLLKLRLNLNESVRVPDALRAMESNKTVYKAFNLKSLLDIEALTDHRQWTDVSAALAGVRVARELKILSPPLENSLLDFTNAGGVNLTQHRGRASRPTVGKDLNALLDQIYATAKYLRDGRTKGRLENLTYKLRDIVDSEYKQLNDLQDRLIYHITALDVLLKPLVKRAEHVLTNLTKFQQSMNFELETVAKNHVVNYTNRLEDYLAQFRANVLYEIKHRTAKTGPLWHIFAATRVTLCDGCVDGINALSFACYLSILMLVCLQPVLWRVVRRFRKQNENTRHSTLTLRRSASEELIHQNPQNWQTPRASQRPGSPDTIVRDLEESVWVSPRQAYEPYLPPPPPRQPSEATMPVENYETASRYSPIPIGFDRSNWSIARDREVSPAPSSTRRWI